jgi:hypothetical protein
VSRRAQQGRRIGATESSGSVLPRVPDPTPRAAILNTLSGSIAILASPSHSMLHRATGDSRRERHPADA